MNLSTRERGGWSTNYSVNKLIFHKAMEKQGMKAEAPAMLTAYLDCFKRYRWWGNGEEKQNKK